MLFRSHSVSNLCLVSHFDFCFSGSTSSSHCHSSSIATTQPSNSKDAKAPSKPNVISRNAEKASNPPKLRSIRAEAGSFQPHTNHPHEPTLHQPPSFYDGLPSHINCHQTTSLLSRSSRKPTYSHYCFHPPTGSAQRRHRSAALNSAEFGP